MIALIPLDPDTLEPAGDAVWLPEDLVWQDRRSWSPRTATQDYGLTGAPLVQTATRSGRPITLVGGSDYGAAEAATLDRLAALRDADALMLLQMAGEPDRKVRWRLWESEPLSSAPIWPHHGTEVGVILRLYEV